MKSRLRHYDVSDSWLDILKGIATDGGVIVENLLGAELLQRVTTELAPHAAGVTPGMSGGQIKQLFCGAQTKRFSGLIAKAPCFAEVMDHDLLHEWAEQEFANDYWANTAQGMIVGPGSPAQMLHRDAGNWPLVLGMGRDGPEATLSCMIALTEFTEDNGATRVVPGSHRWEDFDRQAVESEVVQAVMPAGSALLYSGKTIHGAGENRSEDDWRFGVQLSFVLAQLTPEEAHTITVPWDLARTLSPRMQHMLGYRSHRTFLPDWPVLWTSDYADVRDTLDPPAADDYQSAGTRALPAE